MGHTLAARTALLFSMASKALTCASFTQRCKTVPLICKTKIFYVFPPMWKTLLYIYFGPFKLFSCMGRCIAIGEKTYGSVTTLFGYSGGCLSHVKINSDYVMIKQVVDNVGQY